MLQLALDVLFKANIAVSVFMLHHTPLIRKILLPNQGFVKKVKDSCL